MSIQVTANVKKNAGICITAEQPFVSANMTIVANPFISKVFFRPLDVDQVAGCQNNVLFTEMHNAHCCAK